MSSNGDFSPEELDDDSKNAIATFALTAIFASLYPSSGGEAALSLMKRVANAVYGSSASGRAEDKSQNIYNFLTALQDSNSNNYQALIGALSGFNGLKQALRAKINESLVTGDIDECAVILTSLIFGYSVVNNQAEDFWPHLENNQKKLFFLKTPLSENNLNLIFNESYVALKFAMLNCGPKEDSILYILKYTNVERLFNDSTPVSPNLMKDSEIQSYRISGAVNYYYGFDPLIADCEQIKVGAVTGFKAYPCNRVSVKPRDLQFNQTITDGPYSSGKNVLPVFVNDPNSLADDGIKLLTSIKNSYYDSSRVEDVKILNQNAAVGPFFASYDSGWVFDEFMKEGSRLVNLRGDVGFANNADTFKSFPNGAETGQYHFLGSYTFATGTGVGEVSEYSGFNPILLRLKDSGERKIYSQLEVNLFDKQKRSGQLMAYAVSTERDILSSFSDGDSYQYPLLSIANHTPSIPFIGINLEFSSKTFNKKPAAKFNFGSLYFVPATAFNPGGSFTTTTDFSFTGFDFTGDYFDLSTGSIKFNKEIKNTQNFNPQEAFVNEPVPSPGEGLIPLQSGSRLLQKALGFSNYEDCIVGVEGVKTDFHYGVEYKSIPILDGNGNPIFDGNNVMLVLKPPEIEDEENKHVKRVGDTGVLKYVTGFGPAGNISPLLSKRVFGPLDSNTDQVLDGKDFNYKYLPEDYKTEELLYAHVPALNPARYYSGLFASERRQFLYPSAKKIHDKNKNRYFPHKIKLTVSVKEEYSKSLANLSRHNANVLKTVGELEGYWVDQDFSHPNKIIYGPYGGQANYWTYNPLTNRSLNTHYQYLAGGISISDGKLNQENLGNDYYFDRIEQGDTVPLRLPNTPLESNLKESYSFDIELNYNLPIKSLSDFLDHPENSNKSFISTGDSEIHILGDAFVFFDPESLELKNNRLVLVSGWSERINIDVNNGCDPLFNPGGFSARIPLDNNENISGDSWNGLYLKSGTVVYPSGPNSPPPYRVTEDDKILVEASDNSSNLRLLLRNLKLFPTFVNNDQDRSYGPGNSFVDDSFSSLRQADNFLSDLRVFELNADSILNSIPIESSTKEVSSFTKNISFNKLIEKDITRTGRLYHAPELINGSASLPELSAKEYKQITDLYPQLNGYSFYSGVDDYSKAKSGYFLNYRENSKVKMTFTNAEVLYNRFPDSDELFEFHLTGKAAFSGELSYFTQEESCVITHGMNLREIPNEQDPFQKLGYFFDYCSPQIESMVVSSGKYFPTKRTRRKSKLISSENVFIPTSKSAPDYFNRFYLKTIPEFVHFNNGGSILGEFGVDHLINPAGSLIASSSSNDTKIYDNGEVKKFTEISKECKVEDNIRLYDAYFTNALLNSGFFLQKLNSGLVLNINEEGKTFYAPYGSLVSDLEAGPDKNMSATLVKNRGSDLNSIRAENKPLPRKNN